MNDFLLSNGKSTPNNVHDAQAYHLINEEQLRRYRTENPHLDDVELMARLSIELARQLHRMEAQRCMAVAKEAEPLKCFASLRPSHERLRTALLQLLEMPCPTDRTRPLIYKKSHWIAVMRAMQFLGVVGEQYGARQKFVDYLHELLPDRDLGIMAANLKGIESESPFNRSLTDWHGRLHSQRANYYWRIAIAYLECLAR